MFFCLKTWSVKEVTLCEGKVKQIACSHGRVIHIRKANFGRTKGKSVCPSRYIKTVRCYGRNSLEVVKKNCENKNKCILRATNGYFKNKDPCRGTYKYLQVRYKCLPSEFFVLRAIVINNHKLYITNLFMLMLRLP